MWATKLLTELEKLDKLQESRFQRYLKAVESMGTGCTESPERGKHFRHELKIAALPLWHFPTWSGG